MKMTDCFENSSINLPQRLLGGLDKTFGFLKKDMTIAVSYKLQFVFSFSQIFFSVAVIYFIGQMLGKTNIPSSLKGYGGDYFSFALVGLAVTSYMKAGLVTITNDMRQIMNQGTLEAMCAGPVDYKWLFFYNSLWPFVFETIRVVFYFVVGVTVFGLRFDNANWWGAFLTMMLTIPIFLMLGITSASILVVVKRGDPVNWIFSSAAALLAGTMFPISILPGWLRTVAYCLPLTHSLEAVRRCLLAGASARQVYSHLLALFLFMAVLLPVAVMVNNLCMAKAKRCGAFTTH